MNQYDVLIVGTGPAGLSAALYATRYKLNHLAIGEIKGGQVGFAFKICNIPTEKEILGVELAQKMFDNVKNAGANILLGKVEFIKKTEKGFLVQTNQEEFQAKTIILATGTKRKKLGLEKEKELQGKGVHYCATCDGFFYQDKVVGVVGGGNAALTAALYLSNLAKKVYLICLEKNKQELPAEIVWIDKVLENKKIEIFWDAQVKELIGDENLKAIVIESGNKDKELELNGLFIEIGGVANLPKMDFSLDKESEGLIKVDKAQQTNVKGAFAAGDVSSGSNGFKQIITAMAEGAIAVNSALEYLKKFN